MNNNGKMMTYIRFKKTASRGGGSRKGKYLTCSRTTRKGGATKVYRAGISHDVVKEIDAKGLYHFMVGHNEFTGVSYIIFTKDEEDANVARESAKRSDEGKKYLGIHNKGFIDWVADRYELGEDFSCVKIPLEGDMSNSDEYATYELKQPEIKQ